MLDNLLTKVSESSKAVFKEYFFQQKNIDAYRKVFAMDYQQYLDHGT